MASCLSRAASPRLMSLALHPPSPSGSILRVTSLASTRLGAPIMASCFTRAPLPPLISPAPPPQGPSGSTLGVTSLASTRLRAPLMVSCLTSMATSRRLTSLVPPPPSRWVSTLGVTSLACTRLGVPLMVSCLTGRATSQASTSLGPRPPRRRVSILRVTSLERTLPGASRTGSWHDSARSRWPATSTWSFGLARSRESVAGSGERRSEGRWSYQVLGDDDPSRPRALNVSSGGRSPEDAKWLWPVTNPTTVCLR